MKDWLLETSDGEFPAGIPTLVPHTPVGNFLRTVIDRANPHSIVHQFVRAFRIAEPQDVLLVDDRFEPQRPLLSILIAYDATNTKRFVCWLRGLEQQINQDFKLSIVLNSHSENAMRWI